MKRMLYGIALGFVTSVLAQQPAPVGFPYIAPATFPQAEAPRQKMPPDTKAPPPQQSSTAEVGQQIQEELTGEPALENTNLAVKADDKSVTLSGTVDTQQQHDLAVRIAQSHAGDRKVVDQIKIRG
jgi:osmotically-inducible protein OsmY